MDLAGEGEEGGDETHHLLTCVAAPQVKIGKSSRSFQLVECGDWIRWWPVDVGLAMCILILVPLKSVPDLRHVQRTGR